MADSEAIRQARALVRGASYGTLATIDRHDGAPVATLVAVATDRNADPLLLLSDLAEHTKNLTADGRASLLFDGTAGLNERLTGARVSVIGHVEPAEDNAAADRYRCRHPESAAFSGFGDFHLYRLVIDRAHQVAGFGRIDRLRQSDLVAPPELVQELSKVEGGVIDDMHDNFADVLVRFADAEPGDDVVLTGIDPDGLDLHVSGRPRRVDFPQRVVDVSNLRSTMAALTKKARG